MEDEADVLEALKLNLKRAAFCGLLLISDAQCTEEELYCHITALSYQGSVVSMYTHYKVFCLYSKLMLLIL